MRKQSRKTSDAIKILDGRFYAGHPERLAGLEEARANAEVGREIYHLRTSAGLTQKDLAARVGTSASVISRLEDADYEGHSMAMLRRIAGALRRTVEVRFLPIRRVTAARASAPGSFAFAEEPVPYRVKRPKRKSSTL